MKTVVHQKIETVDESKMHVIQAVGLTTLDSVTNMESCFPAMLFLWLEREFSRGNHGVTGSGHSGTLDLGDLGDKSMIPENATLFSISLLGKKIRSNVRENSM
ncbi:hypothetical protein AVEN_67641-1 [Araneus ventricosus]|uniref:Uncharacterized protein n=1 Tax=Araneus ventricosus TaxID=182803 RepID=A0A4Y2IB22_ARAVE|nr:hypothetical protein AVEN_67641-1 [Araneus ventricosus]